MKLEKLSSAVIFSVLAFCFMPLVVYAASPYQTWGYENAHPRVRSYSSSYNSTWVSIFNNSLGAWNNSTAVVTIGTSPNSNNVLEAAQYTESWYGATIAQVMDSGGNVSQFNVRINTRTISSDATNFSNFAQSVTVHEFGHVFWLTDNPATARTTIMSNSRNRETMIIPQPYDIENVNAKY